MTSRKSSLRDNLLDAEAEMERAFQKAVELGATWRLDLSYPAKIVVTWPTTNAYRNGLTRGLVFERHQHLRVEHHIAKR